MVTRNALSQKVLMLGVDGMDPRLTRKYVDAGKMPNVKKYLQRGSAREDLSMLGGHPTVTPPMWTTLATGCYANVHGITGFYRASASGDLDRIAYNFDSRLCRAEALWNVTAEAGKKTLVWHWPGSAWPPTSDNPNLMVVDGTSPGSVAMAVATIEGEYLVAASVDIPEVTYKDKSTSDAAAPCVVEDLELDKEATKESNAAEEKKERTDMSDFNTSIDKQFLVLRPSQQTTAITEVGIDVQQSPIKEATGWAAAPADAKEFTLLHSKGLIRRPCLIVKGEDGIYDTVEIYLSKKNSEPLAVLPLGKMVPQIVDEAIKKDKKYRVNRNMRVIELAPDGSKMIMYVSTAMDTQNDSVYHPKRLFKEIVENVGYPTPTSMLGHQEKRLITDCMLENWYVTADWQAAAILHLIESEKPEVIFSHFHAIDLQSHMFIKHLADKEFNRLPHEAYEKFMEDLYVQTDYYLGKFIHLLDEGWSILIFSDHAQVAPKHDIPYLGAIDGINVRVMQELGFTVLKQDANGNELPEIDWSKTKAVAQREQHIYINLKGRDPHGIVDPADQYELEEEIMTALYGYKDKKTGKRIVAMALRNRDSVLLGQGGPDAGDICYWLAEGYNYDHADCLSTTLGESDTSVAPIFIGSGTGFKQGYYTNRYIRQIDFTPTVAALLGVRMPRECEGAPVYQIFSEEY